ncbi:MAG: SPOR domain-containing protein [Novosphingobium sp.]|nr:SPOR domain-containing protein [Novosphingobium sp.]
MNGFGDHEHDGEDRAETLETGNTAQLALDDEDERLPWLESGEDDEEEGVDTGRLVGFALIGFAVLAVIVGLIWWLANRGPDPDLVADGGTIEAPEQPYKIKPENPGGKEFAGTGDTSFKVGEGETTDGKLAEPAVPKPAEAAKETAAKDEGGKEEADTGGIGVQVGAYTSKESARAGWNTLYAANEALHGYKYRIVQGQADIGTVYRLQAVAPDAASADSLCAKLKAGGTACQVKR